MATKAKPAKAKTAPAPRKKASNWPRNVGVSLVVVAFVVMAGAIVHLANRGDHPPAPKPRAAVSPQAFFDFEFGIRGMWLIAADKANRGEFKTQAEARKWLAEQWKSIESQAFKPLDELEESTLTGDDWGQKAAVLWTEFSSAKFAGEK